MILATPQNDRQNCRFVSAGFRLSAGALYGAGCSLPILFAQSA
jgi:hypothetical protein